MNIDKVFSYDPLTKTLELNQPELLLIQEFKDLLELDRNKCEEDPTGVYKLKAFRELTYIYLALNWRSPYSQYDEQERHEEALADAQITEEEFNDPVFRSACRKYRKIQDSNQSIRLLEAARLAASQFIEYFSEIINLAERDQNGKPVFSAEKVMKEMAQLSKVHEQLTILEAQVKQEMEVSSGTRAGVQKGYDPGDF